MPSRRCFNMGCSTVAASLLTSCGTIIYPDRVNQEDRGNLDPAIIILDGIGLFFFLIPGVIAFAVDFATGSIYLPADKEPADKERTIFDGLSILKPCPDKTLTQDHIERVVSLRTGRHIDLSHNRIHVVELSHISQFQAVRRRLPNGSRLLTG
jgi:hypothetical protein